MNRFALKFIIIGQSVNLKSTLVRDTDPQVGSIDIEYGLNNATSGVDKILDHLRRNQNVAGISMHDVSSVSRPTAAERYGLDRAGVYLTRIRQHGTRRVLYIVFWLERVETGTEKMARAYQVVQITYPELTTGQAMALAADLAAMQDNENFATLADTLAELKRRVHPATMGGYAATLDVQNARAVLAGREWSCCRLARQRSAGQCPTCPICSKSLLRPSEPASDAPLPGVSQQDHDYAKVNETRLASLPTSPACNGCAMEHVPLSPGPLGMDLCPRCRAAVVVWVKTQQLA